MGTLQQYNEVIEQSRNTFLKKTSDYGTSWRVYRPISVADQIYIKAKRIKNIQEKGVQRVADDVTSEFEGMLNYAIIGLIQLDLVNETNEQLPVEQVEQLYTAQADAARSLMLDKNHDYGEAWREMTQESFVDLSLAKILRIKQIIKNDGKTLVSEGIAANFFDILNYAVFALILIHEKEVLNTANA